MSVDEPAHVRVVDTNHDRARVAGIIGFAGRRHRPVVRSLPRLRARRPHRGLRPRHARRPAHSHCQRRRAQTPRRSSPTRGPAHTLPASSRRTRWNHVLPHDPSLAQRFARIRHRDASPSPITPALKFALTLHPPVAICPSHSWRLSMPGHRRLQLLQSPRVPLATSCSGSPPPAVNRNCLPRRSRARAEPHSGHAHDPAAPLRSTLFLCTTPAPRPLRPPCALSNGGRARPRPAERVTESPHLRQLPGGLPDLCVRACRSPSTCRGCGS